MPTRSSRMLSLLIFGAKMSLRLGHQLLPTVACRDCLRTEWLNFAYQERCFPAICVSMSQLCNLITIYVLIGLKRVYAFIRAMFCIF